MREQNVTTQFQAGLRALNYLASFKDLANKVRGNLRHTYSIASRSSWMEPAKRNSSVLWGLVSPGSFFESIKYFSRRGSRHRTHLFLKLRSIWRISSGWRFSFRCSKQGRRRKREIDAPRYFCARSRPPLKDCIIHYQVWCWREGGNSSILCACVEDEFRSWKTAGMPCAFRSELICQDGSSHSLDTWFYAKYSSRLPQSLRSYYGRSIF